MAESVVARETLKFHLLVIAKAGNDVSVNVRRLNTEDTERLMLRKYNEWAAQLPSFSNWSIPAGLNIHKIANKVVDGKSLWRKFIDLKSFMNNCCIPLWISINQDSDDSIEEKYLKLREKLWYVKEEEKCRRRTGKTIQQFHPNWYPKEWYVFLACGPPAGSQRLGVFRPKYTFIEHTCSHLS